MNVESRHKAKLGRKVHRTHPWWAYLPLWWTYLTRRFRKAPVVGVKPRVRATISAVVTRADGTVEDRGVLWEGSATTPDRRDPQP